MVNVSGQNVAEPNDSATVKTELDELVVNHPVIAVSDLELGQTEATSKSLLVFDGNGNANVVPTTGNKRLCTDANGNLVWR